MDSARAVGNRLPPSLAVSAGQRLRLLQHQHGPARRRGREGRRPVARLFHRAEYPETINRTVFPAAAEFPSPHAQGYFKLPDGKVVDATDWNPSWGWASGNMISTLDDLRVWARDFALGKLISPAMKRERDRFLPA